jgi:hypothetical protein
MFFLTLDVWDLGVDFSWQGKWCWDTMRKDPSCLRRQPPAPAGCEGAWNTRRSPFSGETGGFFSVIPGDPISEAWPGAMDMLAILGGFMLVIDTCSGIAPPCGSKKLDTQKPN